MATLDNWIRSHNESTNLNNMMCSRILTNHKVINMTLTQLYDDFINNTGLIPIENLKPQFREIRNYLAGRVIGATRDESLVKELMKILFCKIKDENDYFKKNKLFFVSKKLDSSIEVYTRIKSIFADIKIEYPELYDEIDEINLDPESVEFIVEKLEKYSLTLSKRDPLGDAFEIFFGNNLRGAEGQFFTPRNVIEMVVEMVDPNPGEIIIDPACGTGGFLGAALHYLKIKNGYEKLDDFSNIIEETIYGIDKDNYLSDIALKHIALMANCHPNIICENSLENEDYIKFQNNFTLKNGTVDIVLTNPPFGSNINVGSASLKEKYELSYKWKYDKHKNKWIKTNILNSKVPPQVLFIERSIKLLKEGGKLGIVLPESIFSGKSYQYIVNYITSNSKILAIISMPEDLFKTSGKSGTHTKTCVVILEKTKSNMSDNSNIFMSEAKWCGHDSRGLSIPHDDLPEITKLYKERHIIKEYNHLGFILKYKDISNSIFIPKYYDPEIKSNLEKLKKSYELISIKEMIDDGVISISTGDEIGKLAYGTGDIPFVRTSDISNWEIKVDTKHGVSEEIYLKYQKKQDVQPNDIILVKDGTYLVGTVAMITKYDAPIIYQSHIYKIRVINEDKMNPFLLLAILSSDVVQKQIFSKRFSQDIIDSLGRRIYEVIIPIPKDSELRKKISNDTIEVIESRIRARELIKEIRSNVVRFN